MKKRPIVLVLLFISLALAAALLQAQSTPEATSLPTATYTPPYSYVLGESVYVRGGPGEFYTPVGQLIAGAFVKPLSRNAAGDWVLIAYYDNYGWIRRDLASWVEDIDALPVIDESNLTPSPVSTNELGTPFVPPTDTPVGNWIRADELGALVRAGPGRTYLRLGQLHTGDLVEPVGRNEDISWIMIRYGEGFGWIAWELAYWQANLDSLPVVSPDNLTPTPTYTDTSTPTNTTTPSPTDTATATASASETPVPADTPTDTATTPPSDTPTGTATSSATPTDTPTETATVIPSVTVTDTPVPSETPVPTDTATNSPIPTETPIPTDTPTETPLPTEIPSATATETATSTAVPTDTPVPSDTPSATALPSETAAQVVVIVPTLTDTALPTYTSVPSSTPTSSATPTYTETGSPAPSDTTVPVNTPTDTATVTSTASGTPAPLPSATAAVSTTSAATQESTATATETASDTAVPVVANRPTDVLAPAATIPPASAPRFPIEAVVGGVGLLLVIGYVGLYWRGQTATERYSGGFVIGECPVCHRGHLTVKSKREPLAGIPRVRRTVRCSACRSVLRETGYRRWRYAIDPLENSALYERYNGRELDEETLKRLAQEPPSNEPPRPRPPTKPPKFLDEGD